MRRALALLSALSVAACDTPTRLPDERVADVAIVTAPREVLAQLEAELTLAAPAGVDIAGAAWRFEDGTRDEGVTVRHTFVEPGPASVTVEATTTRGVVTRATAVVNVQPGIAALASTLIGIVPGGVHTCAIDGANALWCWGYNGNGNLGNQGSATSAVPLRAQGGVEFAQVATGFSHSCALTTSGVAYCWGRNYDGQLGNGTTTDRNVPTPVSTNLTFASIDVGFSHSCAVTDLGAAYCWGANSLGQLGDGSAVLQRLVPTLVSGLIVFKFVRAGYNHTCGLTALGAAWCWGANNRGQIGNGAGGTTESDKVNVPTAVTGATGAFTDLDIGGAHNCGIIAGRVYCWGWNGTGQVGANGGTTCVGQPCFKQPTRIQGGRQYSAVTAGYSHSCGIDANGAGFCWGNNSSGQLGDGTTTNRSDDTRQAGAVQFKTLRAGGAFTCGVSTGNVGYCWGGNNTGKLGLGDTNNRLTPTAVPGLTF